MRWIHRTAAVAGILPRHGRGPTALTFWPWLLRSYSGPNLP